MSLVGCQINPIGVNFHLQNSLEIFDKNSVDKIWSRKDLGGGKCPPSCQLGLTLIGLIKMGVQKDITRKMYRNGTKVGTYEDAWIQ